MNRSFYRFWHTIPTRWMDQDAFGHVNNVQYYSFMDTAVCTFLGKQKAFELPARPFVVHSSCTYKKPLVFPVDVHVGITVVKLGKTSSCTYQIGLFDETSDTPSAVGTFVHVWTDPVTEKPTHIPDTMRTAYMELEHSE